MSGDEDSGWRKELFGKRLVLHWADECWYHDSELLRQYAVFLIQIAKDKSGGGYIALTLISWRLRVSLWIAPPTPKGSTMKRLPTWEVLLLAVVLIYLVLVWIGVEPTDAPAGGQVISGETANER